MQNVATVGRVESASFESFAGLSGILSGVAGLLYAIAFVVLKDQLLSGLFLMLGGIFSTALLVGVYYRLRETDAAFSLWGLWLALAGALGAIIHGGYDLSTAINPPSSDVLSNANIPFLVDPRGLMTFGVASIGTFTLAWLMTRNGFFGKNLAYLGYLLAVLMIELYLARMIIVDAKSLAILLPAALAGFIVNPAWNIWLGLKFWRG